MTEGVFKFGYRVLNSNMGYCGSTSGTSNSKLDGMMLVEKDGLIGVIDQEYGYAIVPCKYKDYAELYHELLATIKQNENDFVARETKRLRNSIGSIGCVDRVDRIGKDR